MIATSGHAHAFTTTRRYVLSARGKSWLYLGIAFGTASFIAGLFVEPQRAWGGYLIGFVSFAALALAGPVFLSMLALSGARWWIALQRIPEAMSKTLPVAGLLGLGLLFGVHHLYEWSHTEAVRTDTLLQHKSAWLNTTAFAVRMIVVFAIWILFARWLLARTAAVEANESEAISKRQRAGAIFLAVLAITFSVASFDWLMSLEPHWFSTMFALMHFAGLGCAGVAAAIVLALVMEKQGALRGVLNQEHLHDLGRLLFSLTLLWAYLWFCQYMLIWYTNIPEETVHYATRQQGSWWLLVQATVIVKWTVPFLALLSRQACRSRKTLGRVAAFVLLGQAMEFFVQVGPTSLHGELAIGIWEVGPAIGTMCLFFLVTLRALEKKDAFPAEHPHFETSISYQTP